MIELSYLKSILHYTPETGKWIWLVDRGYNKLRGKEAGTLRPDGYRVIRIDSRAYRSSRLIWFYMTGEWLNKKEEIDHEDTNPLNETWTNLRKSTRQGNVCNQKSYNKLKVKGVHYYESTGKYRASICFNYKSMHLGYFDNLEDAKKAYERAAKLYHGEFARCS